MTAQAMIINVPEDVGTIQGAINSSEDGDTILVQPGTYGENITIRGRNIVVASLQFTTGDLAYIDSTIISGQNNNDVIKFIDYVDGAILSGFTIRDGGGSGIYLTTYCDPLISYCKIIDNDASYGGGIFMLNYCSPTISNCEITSNSGAFGGGIHIRNYCQPTIVNCNISDNASRDGGGVYIWQSQPTFDNCQIVSNLAITDGGGINCRQSNSTFNNCTIAANIAQSLASGIYIWGISEVIVWNSILWGNTEGQLHFGYINRNRVSVHYSDVEGGRDGINGVHNDEIEWGDGNIDENPEFADSENGNFSLSDNSPCIDAANPESDSDPDFTRSDMGALFYPQQNISIVPKVLVFNDVFPEDSLSLSINNIGLKTLHVSDQEITPENAPFSISNGNREYQIEPGASQEIWILFDMEKEESFPAYPVQCQISSDDRDQGVLSIEITDQFQSAPDDNVELPIDFNVYAVYPNPFNATTTISFDVPTQELVSVVIHDISGRAITTFTEQIFQAGNHSLIWDAGNLSAGIYFARITSGVHSKAVKMVLVK